MPQPAQTQSTSLLDEVPQQEKLIVVAVSLAPCLSVMTRSLSENSVVGPRASVFSPGKDGEAGDVGSIVDTAGCSQAENKPLGARSSFPTDS